MSRQRLLVGQEMESEEHVRISSQHHSHVSSTEGFFRYHFEDSILRTFLLGINAIPWSTGRNVSEYNSLFAQM